MTKLQKKSAHFQNYSAIELLELSAGITALFGGIIVNEQTQFLVDEDMGNIARIVTMQKDILKEVSERIPFSILEAIPEQEERGVE